MEIKKQTASLALLMALLFSCATAWADTGTTVAPVLNQVLDTYKGLSGSWLNAIKPFAITLFWGLVGVDFAYTCVVWVLDRKDVGEVMVGTAKKMLTYGFFFTLLRYGDKLVFDIIESFKTIGTEAIGTRVDLSPDGIVNIGVDVALSMLDAMNRGGWVEIFATVIPVTISAFAVCLSFVVIAGQYMITLVESYLVIGGGIILLGFGGSRWTSEMATAYIKGAVGTGFKLLVCQLVIAAGVSIFSNFHVSVSHLISDCVFICVQSAMFAFLAWSIPSIAASMVSGSPSSTLGGAIGAAATMGAAVAGVAGGAVAAGKAAMEGQSAVSTLKEAASNGGDSRSAFGGGPGSITGSSGGSAGSTGGGSGVGPSWDQPPKEQAEPELPAAAQEAQAMKAAGGGSPAAAPASAPGSASAKSGGPSSSVGGGSAAPAAPASSQSSAGGATSAPGGAGGSQPSSSPMSSASTGGQSAAAAGIGAGASGSSMGGDRGAGSGPGSPSPSASTSPDSPSSSPSEGGDSTSSSGSATSSPSPEASQEGAPKQEGNEAAPSTSLPTSSVGDASGPAVSGGEPKDANSGATNKGRPESVSESIARFRQNFAHSDGASVQVGGISMGHTKD